jgi:hypothetical protein
MMTRATGAENLRPRGARDYGADMSPNPSDDAVRRRAHEIWRRRGTAPGSPEADWYQAERELRAETARAETPTAPPPFPAVPSSPAPPAGNAPKPGRPPNSGKSPTSGKPPTSSKPPKKRR